MAGGGGGGEGEPEFQIAPMIDVLLVLLIFFMSITSAQVLKVEKLPLPVAPNAIKRDMMRNEAIVNVKWDAATQKPTYFVEGRPYKEIKQVAEQMKLLKKFSASTPVKGPNPEYRVVIRGDRDVDALTINQVLNAAGEAGIADVSFAVYNREGE
ncbi:MAG: biopolymer transporter ExbD [Chthoniobacteraceae bacterium]